MKKLALTIAIALGISVGAMAQANYEFGGGLFQRGEVSEPTQLAQWSEDLYQQWGLRTGGLMNLPQHNQTTNQDAPLGSGIALLLGLGGAYLVAKRRKED
jgi:hypothetical protein